MLILFCCERKIVINFYFLFSRLCFVPSPSSSRNHDSSLFVHIRKSFFSFRWKGFLWHHQYWYNANIPESMHIGYETRKKKCLNWYNSAIYLKHNTYNLNPPLRDVRKKQTFFVKPKCFNFFHVVNLYLC